MSRRIICTNGNLGKSRTPSGYDLPARGGKPTLDKVSISEDYDPEDKYKKIYESGIADNTTPLSEANAEEFDVVFIVGGHAAMYDLLAESQELQDLINTVYDNGNIV